METKWKVFAILLIGLLSIGFFFFSKGSNGMDQSETSTEMIKKASMSQAGKDYVVLSVVAPTFNGEKSAADFKNWYQSLDYKDFPVLLDSKGELLKEYGIRSYPSALFINSDGTLAKSHIGYMNKEDILKTLENMQ